MSSPVKKAKDLFADQNGLCHYCELPMTLDSGFPPGPTTATRDHKLPKKLNGPTENFNLVGACFACNNKKGARTYAEFRVWITENPHWIQRGVETRRRLGVEIPFVVTRATPDAPVLTSPSPVFQTPFTNACRNASYPQVS